MRKIGCVFIWLASIIIALIGLYICIFIIPLGAQLSTIGLVDIYLSPTILFIWYYIELLFYWGTSLPCFVVLLLMLIASVFLWKGKAYYGKVKKLLNACVKILFIDSIIYLIGNLIMDYFEKNDFFTMFYACYVITALGLITASIFACLAHKVDKKCKQIDYTF